MVENTLRLQQPFNDKAAYRSFRARSHQGITKDWLCNPEAAREPHFLRRESPFARVSVPNHKTLRPGTLRTILQEAQLAVEKLLEIL